MGAILLADKIVLDLFAQSAVEMKARGKGVEVSEAYHDKGFRLHMVSNLAPVRSKGPQQAGEVVDLGHAPVTRCLHWRSVSIRAPDIECCEG